MSARLPPWLGPVFRGVSLACALAMPAVALGAPKGDDASDDGGAAKKGGKKGKKADDDGDVEASVSSSGASAAAGSGKGAPMKGRFGIGAMRSLSGLNGLWARYYLANRVTLGLTAGVATFSHRDTDDTGEFNRVRTVGAFAVGPELFFWPVQGPRDQQVHADFGAGLRLLTYVGFLGLSEEERSNTLDTPVEIDVEIPAKIQLFIGQRVSINPEFGVAFRIIPGSREPDGNGDFDQNPGTGAGERLGTSNGPGLGFELGNHAGLFMGIGVGFYFGKLP
ncbi:MAG: hypothetical protein KC501_27545 [Myxococcales bacterium]|nr:hypothetical protein [Myxococcales bacterium]